MENIQIPIKPTGNPTSTKEWIICLCEELSKIKGDKWYQDNKYNLKSIIAQLESLDAKHIKVTDINNVFISNNVEDCLNEINKIVIEGKKKIATSITNKGVYTSATSSFDVMSTNINKIKTGYNSGDTINISGFEYIYKTTDNYTETAIPESEVGPGSTTNVEKIYVDNHKNLYVYTHSSNNAIDWYMYKNKQKLNIYSDYTNPYWKYHFDIADDSIFYKAKYTHTSNPEIELYIYKQGVYSYYDYPVEFYCPETSGSQRPSIRAVNDIFTDANYIYIIYNYNQSFAYIHYMLRVSKSNPRQTDTFKVGGNYSYGGALQDYGSLDFVTINNQPYVIDKSKKDNIKLGYILCIDGYKDIVFNVVQENCALANSDSLYYGSITSVTYDTFIYGSYSNGIYMYSMSANKSTKIMDYDSQTSIVGICPIDSTTFYIILRKSDVMTYYRFVKSGDTYVINKQFIPNFSGPTVLKPNYFLVQSGSNYIVYQKEKIVSGIKIK